MLPDKFVIFFCALLALDSASDLESGGISGIRCCREVVRDFVFLGYWLEILEF